MKKLFLLSTVLFLMSFSFIGCEPSGNSGQVVVQEAQSNIGDDLNLEAVGEVVKSSSNPQEIEQKLNADDGINNLDLDGDGKRDYLKVTEYGSGTNHGYSICAVLPDGEPEVAKVEIDVQTNQLTLNGNQQYYGSNNVYQSNFDATDVLLMAYLMQPRYNYYHSPYYYGHYGYGYGYRPVVSHTVYHSRPVVRTKTVYKSVPHTSYNSKISSPNSNNHSASAHKRTSNFNNATKSQKAFKTNTSNTSYKGNTGFGNKKSNSYNSSSSSKSSGYKPSSRPSSSSSSRSSSRSSSSRSKR
jgi:hypothetical protein